MKQITFITTILIIICLNSCNNKSNQVTNAAEFTEEMALDFGKCIYSNCFPTFTLSTNFYASDLAEEKKKIDYECAVDSGLIQMEKVQKPYIEDKYKVTINNEYIKYIEDDYNYWQKIKIAEGFDVSVNEIIALKNNDVKVEYNLKYIGTNEFYKCVKEIDTIPMEFVFRKTKSGWMIPLFEMADNF